MPCCLAPLDPMAAPLDPITAPVTGGFLMPNRKAGAVANKKPPLLP